MNLTDWFFLCCFALTAVFVYLKKTGRIGWRWSLVLLPLYGPPLLAIVAAMAIPVILKARG